MKADEPRQNRIPFMMSDAELAAIDEWRFENRIGTRAEAIRRLCQIGLGLHKEAASIRGAFEKIETIESRLSGLKPDSFDEDEAPPSPEQIAVLRRELSVRTYTLHTLLRGVLGRMDAFRKGGSIEEAEAAASRATKQARNATEAIMKAMPNIFGREIGLDDK